LNFILYIEIILGFFIYYPDRVSKKNFVESHCKKILFNYFFYTKDSLFDDLKKSLKNKFKSLLLSAGGGGRGVGK
jgi:hypothetical protein